LTMSGLIVNSSTSGAAIWLARAWEDNTYCISLQKYTVETVCMSLGDVTLVSVTIIMLQTQVLRVGQVDKPCIGLIQENLIENSVQDCLPYILGFHSLC